VSCLRDVAALRGTHEDPNTYAWRLGSIWSSLHGVGGGFDQDGQRHGDVAVSSVVHGYDDGKVDTGGFSPRGDFTYRCDAGLVQAAGAAIHVALDGAPLCSRS